MRQYQSIDGISDVSGTRLEITVAGLIPEHAQPVSSLVPCLFLRYKDYHQKFVFNLPTITIKTDLFCLPYSIENFHVLRGSKPRFNIGWTNFQAEGGQEYSASPRTTAHANFWGCILLKCILQSELDCKIGSLKYCSAIDCDMLELFRYSSKERRLYLHF